MKKAIRWFFLSLAMLILVLAAATLIGGNILLERYLGGVLTLGNTRVRIYDPDVTWRFTVRADSAVVTMPGAEFRATVAEINPALVQSLISLQATAAVTLHTAEVILTPAPADTGRASKPRETEPPSFPEISPPVDAALRIDRFRVRDSAGTIVSGANLRGEALPTSALVHINSVRIPALDTIHPRVRVAASWADSHWVNATATVGWRRDSVILAAHHRKQNLYWARDTLWVAAESSRPYEHALLQDSPVPRIRNLALSVRVNLDSSGYSAQTDLRADIRELYRMQPRMARDLSTQQLSLNIQLEDTAGQWRLRSRGERLEDIQLAGALKLPRADSLPNVPRIVDYLVTTVQGRIRGIPLPVGDEVVTLDARIADARISMDSIDAHVVTGDGTEIAASLASADNQWQGAFQVSIEPDERWLRAFVDTNVMFQTARIRGTIEGTTVQARSWFTDVYAYGALADSLIASHRLTDEAYIIEDGGLWYEGIPWQISGRIGFAEDFPPMEYRIANQRYGRIHYAMPRENYMEAQVDDVQIDKLPLTWLDTIPLSQAAATGRFVWDMTRHTGSVALNASGAYQQQQVAARADAHWSADSLTLRSATMSLNESQLQARGSVALKGDYFFDFSRFSIDDIATASIEADAFDVAQALALFMTEPPVTEGTLRGSLSYAAKEGFGGTYRFVNIKPAMLEAVSSARAIVEGAGDSLIVRAVTTSENEPLFRDSIRLAVTGALADTQHFTLHAVAGDSLHLRAQGQVSEFETLKTALCVYGRVPLPENAGALRDLYIEARAQIPFDNPVEGLWMETDTVLGVYAVADLDTQLLMASITADSGVVELPSLTVRNREGETLLGRARYYLADGRLEASMRGESFAVGWTGVDKFLIKDIDAQIRSTDQELTANIQFRRASGAYAQPPLKVTGDIRNVSILYRQPLASRNQGNLQPSRRIPTLNLAATLAQSEVSYRLRSFEALQGLFQRSPAPDGGGRENPIRVQLDIQTAGDSNIIDTDILRMAYVGNAEATGTLPYITMTGRVSALEGAIGIGGQSYDINTLQIKWLNTPLEEGQVSMEASKQLAVDCEPETEDSCTVFTRLSGELENMQFSYETDCGGEFGAGANVAAIVFSVRRGCYSPAFSAGAEQTYGEQALSLLEPTVSRGLTQLAERLTGDWIAGASVSGLGTLAADTVTQPIALEVITKKLWGLRFRAQAGYRVDAEEAANPFAGKLALEYTPPVPGFVDSEKWRERLKENVTIEASVETDPENAESTQEDEIQQRIGIIYNYDFWNLW